MESHFPFSPASYSVERRIAGFSPEDQQLVRDVYRLSYTEAVRLINEIRGKQLAAASNQERIGDPSSKLSKAA